MVTRRIMRIGAVGVGLVVAAALLLGTDAVWNMWTTAKTKALRQAREHLIDPSVELDKAVQDVKDSLPRDLASLKSARQECSAELMAQAKAVQGLQEGTALVMEDLKVLAPSVTEGRPCKLRGMELDAAKAKQEAGRLLAKRDQFVKEIQTRSQIIERAKGQMEQLEQAIASAEEAMRTFSAKSQEMASKIALLNAGKKAEALGELAGKRAAGAMPSALGQLDADLDRRLAEQSERARLNDSLAAGDEYLQAVRDKGMQDELRKIGTAGGSGKE